MVFVRRVLAVAVLLVLASCGVANKSFDGGFWSTPNEKVGVVLLSPGKPFYIRIGGQGLLDFAITSAVVAEMSNKISTFDTSVMVGYPQQIANALKARGKSVSVAKVVAAEGLERNPSGDQPPYDYARLAQSLGVDKLIVIRITLSGIGRNYHGFIPLSYPWGQVTGSAVMVSNTSNDLLWARNFEAKENVSGNWDVPPDFPALAAAYRNAQAAALNEVLADLR
jgi:hypothetical protein